jgi:hypothetical protein
VFLWNLNCNGKLLTSGPINYEFELEEESASER